MTDSLLLKTSVLRFCRLAIVFVAATMMPPAAMSAGYALLEIGAETYRVELALTSAERRQGLMSRKQLDRRAGMLLVYRHAGDHRIWMKNMLIPLRVYWIDDDFRVIGIHRLEPCDSDPCPVYGVEQASRYVLELSDHEHALVVGDRLQELSEL